ncbi:nitrilase family protein [Robiginitalea biformata]|uniref:Omega-amidase YafV n=1 Tax=Robiginitalea biformata (strain ATCC BAA-864 / DSM 15991 / KCTC 12146 / HTCC2501) TaxID=313596 RepID=A4CIQ1_ROBBH|nr:nitrilase family protein [Robiginitalea biformata]EAR16809.1 putative hydrolase [Robiginitalea biformata HTCC2501]
MELDIALVQTSLLWEDPPGNRARLGELLLPLRGNTDLIVLPEMFSSGFTMDPRHMEEGEAAKTLDWMREEAAAAGAALCGSLVWPQEDRFTNRFIFVEPDGKYHTYDKRHTFTLAGEDKVYARGTKNIRISYRGFAIRPQVCYDLRFPVWSRNTDDYDMLVYVANWPEARIAAWDTLLRARAIENMAFVIGVNRVGSDPNGLSYVGHSAAYDPLGKQLAYSEREEIVRVRIDREELVASRKQLRFLADRDSFTPGW